MDNQVLRGDMDEVIEQQLSEYRRHAEQLRRQLIAVEGAIQALDRLQHNSADSAQGQKTGENDQLAAT